MIILGMRDLHDLRDGNVESGSIAKSAISRVKYVSSNAILADNNENRVFQAFMDYVDKMLLFFSLDRRGYEGFRSGRKNSDEGIIESGSFLSSNNSWKKIRLFIIW